MKPKIKAKWLEALRSGKYKQTKKVLKDSTGYCCLGVLCDIHRKTIKKKGWDKVLHSNNLKYYNQIEILPENVLKWAGIEDENGKFKYKNGETEYLTNLNDNGKSFKQIANIIEKYF